MNVLKKRATVFTRAGIPLDILLYLQAARIGAIRPLRINDFGIVFTPRHGVVVCKGKSLEL